MEQHVVLVNDVLQLHVLDERNLQPCHTRVEDIVDGCLIVAWPQDDGVLVPIHPEQSLSVSLVHEDAVYNFSAIVMECGQDPFPILKILPVGVPERIQRRAFFRVRVTLRVELTGVINIPGKPEEALQLKTLAQDLSEGGMRICTPTLFPDGAEFKVKMNLLDELPVLQITAKVVGSTLVIGSDARPIYQARMSFPEIKEPDRRRIIRYLVKIQRSMLAKQ